MIIANKLIILSFLEYSPFLFEAIALKIATTNNIRAIQRNPECM
jgi:hypothetical protein